VLLEAVMNLLEESFSGGENILQSSIKQEHPFAVMLRVP